MKSAWKCVRNTCAIRSPCSAGKRQVPVDVALRIDDRRGPRLLVADQIRRVRQAVEVELLEDHWETPNSQRPTPRSNSQRPTPNAQIPRPNYSLPPTDHQPPTRLPGFDSEGVDSTRPSGFSAMSLSRRNFIKGSNRRRSSRLIGRLSVPRNRRARPGVCTGIGRATHHAQRQRTDAPRRRHEAGNARDDAAVQAGPDRHQAWLRSRGVRRVHGAHRRRAALFVFGADAHGAGPPACRRSRGSPARAASCIPSSRRSSTSRGSSARSACQAS